MDAEDFRVACARLDLSYKEMAKTLRVSLTTCSRWAKGTRIPFTTEVYIQQMLADHESKKAAAGNPPPSDPTLP
ncbi:MAG: helix-turn-helix transcriptional regulator [Treponema sp.]|nr:helix-turn-helix transcriptional regulator [Treponema sp.]